MLPGVEEPRHSGTVEWSSVARALASLKDVDVIADCGAVPAAKPPTPLLSSSDLVVLVTRATLRSTHATQGVTGLLRSDLMNSGLGADRLVSIVVGPGHPYPLADVTAALSGCSPRYWVHCRGTRLQRRCCQMVRRPAGSSPALR